MEALNNIVIIGIWLLQLDLIVNFVFAIDINYKP